MTTARLKDNLGGPNTDAWMGSSGAIWGDCPLEAIRNGRIGGIIDECDFVEGFITPTITTLINVDGFACFGSSGATITFDDQSGGAIVLTEATDNESVSITREQHPFWLNSSKGDLWFEAIIKTTTVTTAEQGWMVGLMDTTALSAAVPVTAGGAIADVNFVGFHHPEANTTAFDASYKANGVAAIEVNSNIGTLAANTYVKLGMTYKRKDNKLRFFVDNEVQTSTKTLGAAAGNPFPDDIGLAFVLGQTLANTAAESLSCGWFRCVQLL